jgi:hypothetical protein
MKAPGYVFLLSEYVARLEALLTYDVIPPEVKANMKKRAADLQTVTLNDDEIEELIFELKQFKLFKNPI